MNFATAMQEAAGVLADLDNACELERTTKQTHPKFDSARLRQFLQTEETARGFFVVLLTGELRIADDPPPILTQALKEAPEGVLSVLVKNLVMSTATEVVHVRNKDEANAAGSKRVQVRTRELFRRTECGALLSQAQEMLNSFEGRSQTFAAFMSRVNYDEEQKLAAVGALKAVLQL